MRDRRSKLVTLVCAAVFAGAMWADTAASDESTFAEGLEAYDAGDFESSFAAWRPLAEAGDVEAQVAIAGLYLHGFGVAPDPVEAAGWYRKAAEAGDAVAQLNLGDLYGRGLGVPRDLVQAYVWLSLAADQGRVWPAVRRDEIAAQMSAEQIAAARDLLASSRKRE